MHRFFIPPDWIDGDRVTLEGSLVHQLSRVLRLQTDDRIIVLDDTGWEQEVVLVHFGPDRVLGHIVDKRLSGGEPRTKISLYQSVLKGQHFELVLQKGTELGIVEFVPVIASRCIMSSLDDVTRKSERWQRIILEAAEQSGRGRLPRLRAALLFPRACGRAKRLGGLSLIPWEEEHRTSLRQALHSDPENELRGVRPFSINLFIGPEGGFTSEETETARGYDLIPISLGTRILRAETAGLAAVSAILYELGDMECPAARA
jgi:16S rRNA (uracil1498-N3)-methyltransferase